MLLRVQFVEQVDHLDSADCTIVALVACLGAGPFDGLLDILRGQYSKENGYAAFQRHGGDPLGDLVADVVIMAGGTADHRAEADDGVIPAALCHLGRHQRDLKGSGNPRHMNVILPNLVAQQAVQRTAEELGGNEFVEPGGYDAHLDAFGDQLSLEGFHN